VFVVCGKGDAEKAVARRNIQNLQLPVSRRVS